MLARERTVKAEGGKAASVEDEESKEEFEPDGAIRVDELAGGEDEVSTALLATTGATVFLGSWTEMRVRRS